VSAPSGTMLPRIWRAHRHLTVSGSTYCQFCKGFSRMTAQTMLHIKVQTQILSKMMTTSWQSQRPFCRSYPFQYVSICSNDHFSCSTHLTANLYCVLISRPPVIHLSCFSHASFLLSWTLCCAIIHELHVEMQRMLRLVCHFLQSLHQVCSTRAGRPRRP